jgi:thiamine biosynthesis lipoprotein
LNQRAGKAAVSVSGHTRDVLSLALKYAELSGGRFDPTVAPLVEFWGFRQGTVPERLPSEASIREVLRSVGYRHLRLTETNASLLRRNMRVDLGGIGKGYAVDVAYERITAMGAQRVMLDLGGNIRCCGGPREGRGWKIGVRDPFDCGRILGVLRLTDGLAVATSGNYEQSRTIEGKRYTHIIDPRTGYPVAGMAGVTVVSASAAEADALSTALFVTGLDDAPDVLARLPHCRAIFVPDRRPIELWVTEGARTLFEPAPPLADRVRVIGGADDAAG